MDYQKIKDTYRDPRVQGRWVTQQCIEDSLKELKYYFKVEQIGISPENRPIKKVSFGHGDLKLAMWSQMHGNESTTTKAVLDLLYFLNNSTCLLREKWESFFTIEIIVILNPDGAYHYTRNNALDVDLNRDSVDLSQIESQILRTFLEDFKPHYAFNLHDQRSIFGVGQSGRVAAISFLAPSYDITRQVNANRALAMQLIAKISTELCGSVPGYVGRFDDSFNINCIGDYCQSKGIATLLFEAGHYPKDYQREKSRGIVFESLLIALDALYNGSHLTQALDGYHAIAENQKNFTDITFENVVDLGTQEHYIVNVQYKEVLVDKNLKFYPIVVDICKKQTKFAHLSLKSLYVFRGENIDKEECLNKNLEEVISISREEVKILLKK